MPLFWMTKISQGVYNKKRTAPAKGMKLTCNVKKKHFEKSNLWNNKIDAHSTNDSKYGKITGRTYMSSLLQITKKWANKMQIYETLDKLINI